MLVLALPLLQLLFARAEPSGGVCGELARHVQGVVDAGEMLEELAGGEGEVGEGDEGVGGGVGDEFES